MTTVLHVQQQTPNLQKDPVLLGSPRPCFLVQQQLPLDWERKRDNKDSNYFRLSTCLKATLHSDFCGARTSNWIHTFYKGKFVKTEKLQAQRHLLLYTHLFSTVEIFISGINALLAWIILCLGLGGRVCLVHCRMLSSNPGLYQKTLASNISRHCQMSPGEQSLSCSNWSYILSHTAHIYIPMPRIQLLCSAAVARERYTHMLAKSLGSPPGQPHCVL